MNRRGRLNQGRLQSISRISPWHGRTVVGMPLHTIVRGRFVMRDGELVRDAAGWGASVKSIQNMPPPAPRNTDSTTRAIATRPADAPASARPPEGAQDSLWADESYLHPLPPTGH
jgi:dihydroorotase